MPLVRSSKLAGWESRKYMEWHRPITSRGCELNELKAVPCSPIFMAPVIYFPQCSSCISQGINGHQIISCSAFSQLLLAVARHSSLAVGKPTLIHAAEIKIFPEVLSHLSLFYKRLYFCCSCSALLLHLSAQKPLSEVPGLGQNWIVPRVCPMWKGNPKHKLHSKSCGQLSPQQRRPTEMNWIWLTEVHWFQWVNFAYEVSETFSGLWVRS